MTLLVRKKPLYFQNRALAANIEMEKAREKDILDFLF